MLKKGLELGVEGKKIKKELFQVKSTRKDMEWNNAGAWACSRNRTLFPPPLQSDRGAGLDSPHSSLGRKSEPGS